MHKKQLIHIRGKAIHLWRKFMSEDGRQLRQALLLIGVVSLVAYWQIGGNRPVADEVFHYKQIRWFADGHFDMREGLTNLPGYHAVIAFFAFLVMTSKMSIIRLFSILLALASLPVFYWLYRRFSSDNRQGALLRMLQFYFFPLFFPYIFLLYTDMFSLTLVLASFYLMVKRRHGWSGLVATASFCVRQSNVIWLAFVFLYGYLTENGWHFSWERIGAYLRRAWAFVAGGVAFVVFVLLNHGVAIGDKANHVPGIYFGNVYFMLFLVYFLFLPFHIENIPAVIARVKRSPLTLLLPAVLIGYFLLRTPELHVYNFTHGFLRNEVLLWVYSSTVLQIGYAFCAGYAALALIEFGLGGAALLVYPMAVLSVLPEWLIEQRYAMPAMALLLVFRKRQSARAEYATLILWAIISLIFFWGIADGHFML